MNLFELRIDYTKKRISSKNTHELIENKQYKIIEINEEEVRDWSGNWKKGSILTFNIDYSVSKLTLLSNNNSSRIEWIRVSSLHEVDMIIEEL